MQPSPVSNKVQGAQRRIKVKQQLLFSAVDRFFDCASHFERFFKIVYKEPKRRYRKQKRPRMSLRLIDYAVSVYSMNGAMVSINTQNGLQIKSVQSVYRAGLASHGRSHYDAFRRNNSFVYRKHGKEINTTLAQLVFFRDLIRFNILDWIQDNVELIKAKLDIDFPKMPRRTRTVPTAFTGSVQQFKEPISMT
jgi:hypothetical protein